METSKLRKRTSATTLFDPAIVVPAVGQAFVKLDPRTLMKNPVMFVLEVVTLLTTVILVRDIVIGGQSISFEFQIVIWLWFTVLFANFAEAVAEGRGKAQADTLRRTRTETRAKRVLMPDNTEIYEGVSAEDLEAGDLVVCEPGDIIPGDGEVIEGIASVNEAAITGESAPVIRESGGDRSAVTGGTTVLSDRIVVRITSSPGTSFLDRMIKLVEGAERQKTPNEIALNILLVGLTIIFVFATATIPSYVAYADTHHHRRAAVGDRHRRHGPAGALQCARHVRPRRGGGGRRRYTAARQDRNRDVRQSAGDRDHSGPRRDRARGGRGGAAGEQCRRNRRRSLHHHAGAGKIRRVAAAGAGGREVH
jgi:cation transport ATPase